MEVVHSGTAGSGESSHSNNRLMFQKYTSKNMHVAHTHFLRMQLSIVVLFN